MQAGECGGSKGGSRDRLRASRRPAVGIEPLAQADEPRQQRPHLEPEGGGAVRAAPVGWPEFADEERHGVAGQHPPAARRHDGDRRLPVQVSRGLLGEQQVERLAGAVALANRLAPERVDASARGETEQAVERPFEVGRGGPVEARHRSGQLPAGAFPDPGLNQLGGAQSGGPSQLTQHLDGGGVQSDREDRPGLAG